MSAPSTTPTREALALAEREALDVADDPILRQMLDEERIASDVWDTSQMWRLARYLAPHRALTALAVALATIEAFLMTLPAYLIGMAIDRVGDAERDPAAIDGLVQGAIELTGLAGRGPTGVIYAFGVIVGTIWVARWLVAVVTTYLMQMLGQNIVHDLRRDVYDHITGMDLGFFHKNPVGRLVNRTTFDIASISQLFSDALAQGVRDVLFIVVLFGVMVTLDPWLTLVLALSFPPLIATALTYRRFARPAMRTNSAVQSRMNAWWAENIAGMRENQLYRREPRRRAEFAALTDAHQRSIRRVIQAWGLLRPVMMMVSACATSVVLWVGYARADAGLLSIGVLLTFLQYTARLWVPVRNLTEKFNLIQTSLTSAERVFDVLDTSTGMEDAPDADASLTVKRGRLTFDDVRFTYPGTTDEVLRGVSFDVPPGNMLALVGDTGAGKSTIAHLISRFYDVSEGEVRVDDRPVSRYTLEQLRGAMALVPQDVVVFAGSLRDNITMGADVSDAQILRCLEAVRATSILDRLDGGLDAPLDEGGRTLSVGERQLLSFARALVVNPPLLILDEATANIDTETEMRIQRALEELTQGRTSVVIAHRLSTIRHADEILVLRHGQIVERGRHDDLLALGGEYARLHELHVGAESS